MLLVGFEQQSKQSQPPDDKCWQGDNQFVCLLIPTITDGSKKILKCVINYSWINVSSIVCDETQGRNNLLPD